MACQDFIVGPQNLMDDPSLNNEHSESSSNLMNEESIKGQNTDIYNASDGDSSDRTAGSCDQDAEAAADVRVENEPHPTGLTITCGHHINPSFSNHITEDEVTITADESGIKFSPMSGGCGPQLFTGNQVKSINVSQVSSRTVVTIRFVRASDNDDEVLSHIERYASMFKALASGDMITDYKGYMKPVADDSSSDITWSQDLVKPEPDEGEEQEENASAAHVKTQDSLTDSQDSSLLNDSIPFDLSKVGLFTPRPPSVPSTPTELNIHVSESQCIVENGVRRWQCAECDKSYTTKHNLQNHIMGHRGIKPHACHVCAKNFKQASHLQTHMLTHSNERPHTCQVCGKAFVQMSHLKRHMTLHMDKRPYTCEVCNRGFAFPSELQAHIKKKCTPSSHKCEECGQSFDSPKKLKHHHTMVHRTEAELVCADCGRAFSYPSQLREHQVIHTGKRPHICTECGMDFVKEHHLKSHMFTHTGLKPFACPKCGRCFNQKANMQRHLLTHDNKKQYACHICGRPFSQPQTLKAHMVTHSDRKPYHCNVCGKEFGRLHNLQGHMHIHKDTKPFACFCGAKFTLKGNMVRHRKVKHNLNEGEEVTDEQAAEILRAMAGAMDTSIKSEASDTMDSSMGDTLAASPQRIHDNRNIFDVDNVESPPAKKSRKSIPRRTLMAPNYALMEAEDDGEWGGEEERSEVDMEEMDRVKNEYEGMEDEVNGHGGEDRVRKEEDEDWEEIEEEDNKWEEIEEEEEKWEEIENESSSS